MPDSRQLKPAYLAAIIQPPNFPVKASTQMAAVKAHIVPKQQNLCQRIIGDNCIDLPVFSKPRSVERPESVKYWITHQLGYLPKQEKLTNGRNITETISSSFSVRVMARPPSRGTMIPARNAFVHHIGTVSVNAPTAGKIIPNTAWTPMTSVKNADPNKTRIVMVINNIVGPFSIERVLRAIQKSILRTTTSMKIDHPMQTNKIHNAVSPLPAFTRATLRASNVHPMMSLPTPAERTTIPTVVSSSLSSVRMRHNTGNAVIEYATPVKSMKCGYDTCDESIK